MWDHISKWTSEEVRERMLTCHIYLILLGLLLCSIPLISLVPQKWKTSPSLQDKNRTATTSSIHNGYSVLNSKHPLLANDSTESEVSDSNSVDSRTLSPVLRTLKSTLCDEETADNSSTQVMTRNGGGSGRMEDETKNDEGSLPGEQQSKAQWVREEQGTDIRTQNESSADLLLGYHSFEDYSGLTIDTGHKSGEDETVYGMLLHLDFWCIFISFFFSMGSGLL